MIESQSNSSGKYQAWSVLLTGAILLIDLFHHVYPRSSYGAFDDDFFYYAQVARHLTQGDGSTFDGIHQTNGYHPLWLLGITFFSFFDYGRLLIPLVTITAAISVVSILVLCLLILKRIGVAISGQYVIATLIAFESELLLRGGMEVILTMPLILLLLYYYLAPDQETPGFFLRLGLISSLCVLSRLDSIIVTFLLLAFSFGWRVSFRSPKAIAFIAGGLTPLWSYLLINKCLFGNLTPVSARAKQLRLHHTLQFEPMRSLIHPLTAVRIMVVVPGIIGVAVLLTLLLRQSNRISKLARPVLWSLTLFPIVQLFLLAFLSDWPLWYWYFYPLLLAFFVSMAALASLFNPAPKTWAVLAVIITIVSLGYTLTYNINHPPAKNPLFLASQDIALFTAMRPGIYAMGDRSGTAGYMSPAPMIQLEGLVEDRKYLDRLRTQPPLNSVLREYGVAYYVSTNATLKDGCYYTREPLQAGADSAHMLGTFCQSPIAVFNHNGINNQIFAINPAATH